jgi:hypothetical protein
MTQVVYFADYELRHGHVDGAITDAQRVVHGTHDRIAREMAFRDLGIANTQLASNPKQKRLTLRHCSSTRMIHTH